ncbi:restriction endonuclease subunit S [Fructilactobacillus sanfranciscensis]|uniref:restriction endonuclease subunit S n=1 Tax=Fructilactobacillus sanfranciscensis TaxID=1625 RepID=UPI000CD43C94|nr:restriction endonuclease subunit S [Fructilactobacillus sanfranciscensis]NDR69669.1 restriction endonuclease subunit S [Fructilactobacillus sanfranciscensis]NDS16111.1 restriction endonuclease subunit S [Fructilactobacillus sanfranciscensis]POH20189.1 hypothetical protein BGL46_03300 [Fructilactobacillus sanfranciscensis]
MNNAKKTLVPHRRFKEFQNAGAWEERQLKELGDIQTGNTPPTSDSDNYSLDGVLWVTPTDIKSLVISNTAKKLSQVGVTKARIAKAGSILVTSIASIGKNTLLRMDAGFNQQINSLTPTSENDSYFLLTQSEKWSEKMKQTAASATMQIVNKTDFSNISTYVPVHKEEQQKIGSFFKQLDDTIVLHQRKLNKLKKLKSAYLTEMFPAEGERKPKRRFAGFTDDWEERKLTEIVNRVNKSSNSDVLPKVEFEDIVSGEGRLNKDISSKLDSRKGTLFESENILYGKLRPYLKNWLFPDFEGVALGDFWVFEATDVSVPSFDYYLIQSDDYQKVANNTSGTKMPRSNWKNVSSTDFAIPSKDEQKQIGAFFKQLDDTITLHQRKIGKLKKLKDAYLNEMFV